MSSENKEFIKDLLFVAQYCRDEYNGLRADKLLRRAAELIKNLQADKDALIAGQETLQKALAEKDNEIKRLQERNVILRGAVDTQKNDNKMLAGHLADAISHEPRSEAEIKTEARKELAQKLKEQFNDLEFNVKTPRKTLKVEELQDQVNWILREVVIQTIDSVLDETTGGSDA